MVVPEISAFDPSRLGLVTSELEYPTRTTELDKRMDAELNGNILRSNDGHEDYRHRPDRKKAKVVF